MQNTATYSDSVYLGPEYHSLCHFLKESVQKKNEKLAYVLFSQIINNGWAVNRDDSTNLLKLLVQRREKTASAKVFIAMRQDLEEEAYTDVIDLILETPKAPAINRANQDYFDLMRQNMKKSMQDKNGNQAFSQFTDLLNHGWDLNLDDSTVLLSSFVDKRERITASKVLCAIQKDLTEETSLRMVDSVLAGLKVAKINIINVVRANLDPSTLELYKKQVAEIASDCGQYVYEVMETFDTDSKILLAFNEEEKIIGYLIGKFMPHSDKKSKAIQVNEHHFYLEFIGVDKNYRREKDQSPVKARIGTQLMWYLFNELKETKIRYLAVEFNYTMDSLNDEWKHRRMNFYTQFDQQCGITMDIKRYKHLVYEDEETYECEYAQIVSLVFDFIDYDPT